MAVGTAECRNCGALAGGVYCPQCGQETAVALPTARTFLKDAAGRYVALDGRLWRTLGALVFRPGWLTREYLLGRRRRYVRPGRLFLVLSLLMFAVLRISLYLHPQPLQDAVVIGDGAQAPKPAVPAPPGIRIGSPAPEPAAGPAPPSGGVSVDVSDTGDVQVKGIPGRLGRAIEERVGHFNRLAPEERVEQLFAGMIRYGPYAMFVLLPVFALLLHVAYLVGAKKHPHRPRVYAAHLVFAAHYHALLFLLTTVATTVAWVPLQFVANGWVLAYGPLAMKRVYGGSWIGVMLRALLVWGVYLGLLVLATLMLVLAAVTLR